MAETAGLIDIEVAYARTDRQYILQLQVPPNTTLMEAVEMSGLLQECPEIDWKVMKLGIFGAVCDFGQTIRQSDRVEIYHPLRHDPKQSRRLRAVKS